jgi:ABC-2 type transport system permease protein
MSAVTLDPTRTATTIDRPWGARCAEAWRETWLLVRWQLNRSKEAVPLLVLVQLLLAVSTVIGYGLIVGDPGPIGGLYLATGAPTVTLVMVGLVMTPQWMAQARTEGSLDWMRTLPVPRGIFLVADLLVWTGIALPGLVVGILVGRWRFDVDLSPTWWFVPAAIVVSLTAAAIGYAVASLLVPTLAQLVSQVFVFLIMLFTPVCFPADRLAPWAQHLHQWLPFEPMAQVVRAGLAPDAFTVPGRSVAVLLTWCVLCVAGAAAALRRRG